MKRTTGVMLITLVCFCAALSQKSMYLDEIKQATARGWQEYPAQLEQ